MHNYACCIHHLVQFTARHHDEGLCKISSRSDQQFLRKSGTYGRTYGQTKRIIIQILQEENFKLSLVVAKVFFIALKSSRNPLKKKSLGGPLVVVNNSLSNRTATLFVVNIALYFLQFSFISVCKTFLLLKPF